jgi:hypothetical protein
MAEVPRSLLGRGSPAVRAAVHASVVATAAKLECRSTRRVSCSWSAETLPASLARWMAPWRRRLEPSDRRHGPFAVPGGAHDLDVVDAGQRAGETVAEDRMVIHDEDSHGVHATEPAATSTATVSTS